MIGGATGRAKLEGSSVSRTRCYRITYKKQKMYRNMTNCGKEEGCDIRVILVLKMPFSIKMIINAEKLENVTDAQNVYKLSLRNLT